MLSTGLSPGLQKSKPHGWWNMSSPLNITLEFEATISCRGQLEKCSAIIQIDISPDDDSKHVVYVSNLRYEIRFIQLPDQNHTHLRITAGKRIFILYPYRCYDVTLSPCIRVLEKVISERNNRELICMARFLFYASTCMIDIALKICAPVYLHFACKKWRVSSARGN